jgi:hypothetical protein
MVTRGRGQGTLAVVDDGTVGIEGRREVDLLAVWPAEKPSRDATVLVLEGREVVEDVGKPFAERGHDLLMGPSATDEDALRIANGEALGNESLDVNITG